MAVEPCCWALAPCSACHLPPLNARFIAFIGGFDVTAHLRLELDLSCMHALIQAAGLPRNTPRKYWPLSLLKQILTESIQETPRHLLARELWCGSGSASEWWSFQAGYTSSTAAISMVLPFNNHIPLQSVLCSSSAWRTMGFALSNVVAELMATMGTLTDTTCVHVTKSIGNARLCIRRMEGLVAQACIYWHDVSCA